MLVCATHLDFHEIHILLMTNLIDDATSEMIPNAQSDLAKNMDICDVIRSRNVSARDAVRSLKRRLLNANPNVQLLALGVC